ncbi:MAG: methylated-DNA--[protein]-cysteine S-methyltransferase [Syntrophobacter sp.]
MSTGFRLGYLLVESPLGWIILAATAQGVCMVGFLGPVKPSQEHIMSFLHKEFPEAVAEPASESGIAGTTAKHILDYLNKRLPLPEIPVDLRKGTEFERGIWREISAIPFGETRSYGQIASAAGNPAGARAAGGACGKNPVPIIIPCHRVIASSGKLGGFSGGLDIKRALLELEKDR